MCARRYTPSFRIIHPDFRAGGGIIRGMPQAQNQRHFPTQNRPFPRQKQGKKAKNLSKKRQKSKHSKFAKSQYNNTHKSTQCNKTAAAQDKKTHRKIVNTPPAPPDLPPKSGQNSVKKQQNSHTKHAHFPLSYKRKTTVKIVAKLPLYYFLTNN